MYVSIHRNVFVTDNAPVKYIFVKSQKEKATELKDKIDAFENKFDRHLLIEILAKQGLVFLPDIHRPTDLWLVSASAADKKELGDLVSALGENRLSPRKPCMEGTRTAILQKIEDEIKNANGPNMIWIRGSPGVGKSALAASIARRLEDQKRRVISFRFDRTQSTTITTNALWRAVACDLARFYPSLRPHLTQGIQGTDHLTLIGCSNRSSRSHYPCWTMTFCARNFR